MELLNNPHEGTSLLVIENDLGFANHIKQLLAPLGIEVEIGEADDLAEITKRPPDLIVVSAQLNDSERAGFSLCQRIRRDETLQFVKIIITAEKPQRDSLHFHESTDERADRYIVKPISDDELRREIVSLLNEEYISSGEEESVAFIDDAEVLEIEPDPASAPPPLPNMMLEPWQATSFEEMVNTRSNIDSPVPPRQPDEESRLAYLRERVRFLENKERAMREAWNLIQEQGKDMERQAANGQFAAQKQHEELLATKEKLRVEKQKFRDFNQKITGIFASKDEEEARLHRKIQALNLEQKRRQRILENLEQQYEDIEANLAEEKTRYSELESQKKTGEEQFEETKKLLVEEYEAAMAEAQQTHEAVLEDLRSNNESQMAVVASEHASELLEVESRHSGLILNLTEQRDRDFEQLETKAKETLKATVQQLSEEHSEAQFLMDQELKRQQQHQKEQADILRTLVETERAKVFTARLKQESDASAYNQLRHKQDETELERNTLQVECNQLKVQSKELQTRHSEQRSLLIEKQETEKQLVEKIEALERELAERYLEIETLHSDFSVLEVQAETKAEQLTALQAEELEIRRKQEEDSATVLKRDEELRELTESLAKEEKISQKLRTEVNSLHEIREALTEELETLQEVRDAQAENLSRIENFQREQAEELETLQETREAHEEELKQLKVAKEDAETKRLENRVRWQDAEQNAARLTSKVQLLETQRDRLSGKLETQTKELAEAKQARAELERTRAELDRATRRIDQLHSEKQETEKSVSVAKIELAQSESQREQAENALRESNAALELAQKQRQEDQSNLQQLKEELARTDESTESEQQRRIHSLERQLENQIEGQKKSQEKYQELEIKLGKADAALEQLESQLGQENSSLEEELADAQSSLFEKLETIRNLEQKFEEADIEFQEVETERNVLLARLDGAIRRIDDLEAQLITKEQLSELRRLNELDSDNIDSSKRKTLPPNVAETEKDETVDIGSLPSRNDEPVEKTTTELHLPKAYMDVVKQVEAKREQANEDIISLEMDDSVIISIATSDVESLDEDTNTIRGEVELLGTEDLESLESALDEKTSPSVTEVHSDALTPINYDEIEEKLAAVQALEFKGGEILSQPSEDPFINPGNNQGD